MSLSCSVLSKIIVTLYDWKHIFHTYFYLLNIIVSVHSLILTMTKELLFRTSLYCQTVREWSSIVNPRIPTFIVAEWIILQLQEQLGLRYVILYVLYWKHDGF